MTFIIPNGIPPHKVLDMHTHAGEIEYRLLRGQYASAANHLNITLKDPQVGTQFIGSDDGLKLMSPNGGLVATITRNSDGGLVMTTASGTLINSNIGLFLVKAALGDNMADPVLKSVRQAVATATQQKGL